MGIVQEYFKKNGLEVLAQEEEDDCVLHLINAHKDAVNTLQETNRNYRTLVKYIHSRWYLKWILDIAYSQKNLD